MSVKDEIEDCCRMCALDDELAEWQSWKDEFITDILKVFKGHWNSSTLQLDIETCEELEALD